MTESNWKSPYPDRLPDFIIGGAMKSGTTTLRHILREHPEIYIPNQEIGFFDIDNILQHGDFNFYDTASGKWTYQNLKKDPEKYWNWYYSKFEEGKGKTIGEDSTTYLASRLAAKRIALQEKPVKMIFSLRHPVKRAISQYYHMLRTGRAIYTLEDTVRFEPWMILDRSRYFEQLKYYYDHIPQENIMVLRFEDLIGDIKSTIKDVCKFIGVEFDKIPSSAFETHANRSQYPKNERMQLWKNRKFRGAGNLRYVENLPDQPENSNRPPSIYEKLINKFHYRFNPLTTAKPEPVSQSTIEFLNSYFLSELEGIDELTKMNLFDSWFPEEK